MRVLRLSANQQVGLEQTRTKPRFKSRLSDSKVFGPDHKTLSMVAKYHSCLLLFKLLSASAFLKKGFVIWSCNTVMVIGKNDLGGFTLWIVLLLKGRTLFCEYTLLLTYALNLEDGAVLICTDTHLFLILKVPKDPANELVKMQVLLKQISGRV